MRRLIGGAKLDTERLKNQYIQNTITTDVVAVGMQGFYSKAGDWEIPQTLTQGDTPLLYQLNHFVQDEANPLTKIPRKTIAVEFIFQPALNARDTYFAPIFDGAGNITGATQETTNNTDMMACTIESYWDQAGTQLAGRQTFEMLKADSAAWPFSIPVHIFVPIVGWDLRPTGQGQIIPAPNICVKWQQKPDARVLQTQGWHQFSMSKIYLPSDDTTWT